MSKEFWCKMQDLGKGIGNPSRYRILEVLMAGPKTVGEIVKAVRQTQPAVSQHLKTLKTCNLVVAERRGQEVLYRINQQLTLSILKDFISHLQKWKKRKQHEIRRAQIARNRAANYHRA